MNDNHIKVLLVEDEARDARLIQGNPAHSKPIRELLAQARDASFDLECTDPPLGLERLAHGSVDAVLLDASLSENGGHATFTRLHTQAPDVPIIILTSGEDETLATKLVQESGQGYLVKEQVNEDILVRAMCNAIERQRLVTGLKQQIREELQASEARFHNIIENAADGIIIVGEDGTICFVNPAAEALFGRRAKELVGELFGFPVVAGETTEIDITRRRQEPAAAEMRVVKTEWEGKVAYLASLRDMTEHKRLLAELEQTRQEQLRMKDQFLSRVSHELRSPLTPIHQFVTILLDGLAGDLNPEQREYLEIVLRNVSQLRTMVSDLLEVTRAEAGRLTVDLHCVYLTELIPEILKPFQIANTKGIFLSADVSPALPSAYADPKRVRQILSNLLNNALKFTPENGKVTVQAQVSNENSGFLCITVTDTGCGISPEESKKIFEYLYQGDNNPDAGRKGLGLGLYICKELVSQHGGQIWVESQLGRGSTFLFTLPIFSLERQLVPILTAASLLRHSIALITVEISHIVRRPIKRTTDQTALRETWNALQLFTQPNIAALLPRTAYTDLGEIFFMVVCADQSGVQVLVQQIRERLAHCHGLRDAGLDPDVSFTMLDIPFKRNRNPSRKLVDDVRSHVEELIKTTLYRNRRLYEQAKNSHSG